MRNWILGMSAITVVATAGLAQREERLSKECRREVVKLCGMDRSKMRDCLMEKRDQLSADCTAEIKARIVKQDGGKTILKSASGGSEFSYGSDAKQTLDFWPVKANTKAPLVVFVHGGGWSIGDKSTGTGTKPQFYNGMDYAFASLNYRLVPNATVEQQAADIAAAIAYLRGQASKLGFDGDRIYLMGHSAGAHLAGLVSTDASYAKQAGVPLSAIKGTILLDGAGYDVPKQMAYKDNKVPGMYEAAFGKDVERQRALSPITHVGDDDVKNWLLLHVESRKDSGEQSNFLSDALSKNGASTKVLAVPDSTHMSVNKDAGVADSFVGNAIAEFLKR